MFRIVHKTPSPQVCIHLNVAFVVPLTIATLAHTPRNTTAPSDAPMPAVAPAASGTGKTSHAIVTLNIRQQWSGIARTRLASTREAGARSLRGKTTSTDTFGPCTVERTSYNISSIPIHVPSLAPNDRCAPSRRPVSWSRAVWEEATSSRTQPINEDGSTFFPKPSPST